MKSEKKSEEWIDIEVGENAFVFKDVQSSGGFKQYKAVLSCNEDSEIGNNEYTAFTTIELRESAGAPIFICCFVLLSGTLVPATTKITSYLVCNSSKKAASGDMKFSSISLSDPKDKF